MTTAIVPGDGPVNMTAILAGGPAVDTLISGVGLHLVVRRRKRLGAPSGVPDAVAVALAFTSLRWLTRVPAGLVAGQGSGSYVVDEALVSMHAGAPAWALPGLLALAAILIVARVMRGLAPERRAGDVLALLAGEGAGLALCAALAVD